MKLALHRSIIFWSGLLVMGFITWAWRDSGRRWCGQYFDDLVVASEDSVIMVCHRPGSHFGWKNVAAPVTEWGLKSEAPRFATPGISLRRELTGAEKSEVRQGGTLAGRKLDHLLVEHYLSPSRITGELFIVIPYWLMLLLFAVPWCALLFWRARRRKRMNDR